jgi:hypothetical protein
LFAKIGYSPVIDEVIQTHGEVHLLILIRKWRTLNVRDPTNHCAVLLLWQTIWLEFTSRCSALAAH